MYYDESLREGDRLRAEIERLRARLEVREDGGPDGIECRDETIRMLDQEITRLRAEVEALRKCCTQRGARMQIMREWMDHDQGIGPPNDWWYFCEETPGAEHWFDADGVPIEDAALRGEGER